jgi:hypothetical protein
MRFRVASLAIAAAACAGSAAAAPASPPPTVHTEDLPGGLEWRQTFMAPRVTGNLRVVAVDPSDPKNLYVGTEEGTLAHSTDGGLTWDEVELSPFLLQSPTIRPGLTGDAYKAMDVFAGFKSHLPPFIVDFDPFHRIGLPGAGPGLTAPQFTSEFVFPVRLSDGSDYQPLLAATAAADPKGYEELIRVKVCPGAEYGVLVATKTKLFGTPDGASFVPVFSTRETAPIEDLACSQANTSEILVATGDGTFRSVDGGGSFDVMGGSFGPAGSGAVVFGPTDTDGKEQIYAATGSELWVGDPNIPEAIHTVTSPGPTPIRSIAVTPRSIWVAMDDGVRVSHDGGATWESIADIDHFHWNMIAAIPRADGSEYVAVLREELVVASEDGVAFHPSFRGLSRRRVRQIAASSEGFYLVTSGEVWTTTAPQNARAGDEGIRHWAERRLRSLPSLTETMRLALVRARLTDVQLDSIESKLKTRAWLPSVVFSGGFNRQGGTSANETAISNPLHIAAGSGAGVLALGVSLNWSLPELVRSGYNVTTLRRQLYDLRVRFSYVVEDAYNERRQVLGQIAAGGLQTDELLTLESRVEVLDLVLEELTTGYGLGRSKEDEP